MECKKLLLEYFNVKFIIFILCPIPFNISWKGKLIEYANICDNYKPFGTGTLIYICTKIWNFFFLIFHSFRHFPYHYKWEYSISSSMRNMTICRMAISNVNLFSFALRSRGFYAHTRKGSTKLETSS